MKTDKHTVEVLVRAFFNTYFSKAAGRPVRDITTEQPIIIKQLFVKNIDDISKDFNSCMARSFALINRIDVPEKLSSPKTFEGFTALIKYTLGGDKVMYEHMVECYKYHFTQALSGIVEKIDVIKDKDISEAIRLMK